MRFIELAAKAKARLLQDDAEFHDKAARVLGLLRSLEVVPTRRASLWGHWHMLLSAMLVMAYEADATVDVTTRRKGALADAGLSTNFIKWLDNLVAHKLLIPANGSLKASGILSLAVPLIEQVN